MSREIPVRFCEGGGVRFPSATRLVVMCRTERDARAAKEEATAILSELKLKLHPQKTRIANLTEGLEEFTFLGCTLRKVRSRKNGRKFYLNRWPSPKSMARIRERLREATDIHKQWRRHAEDVIAVMRPIMLGWAAYFRTGNASRSFAKIERHALRRLQRFLARRSQRSKRPLTFAEAHQLGLPRLQGTIRYPGGANARTA